MQAITLRPTGRLHFDGSRVGSNFMTLCDADTFEYRVSISRMHGCEWAAWFFNETRSDELGRRWTTTSGSCVQDDFGNLVEVNK